MEQQVCPTLSAPDVQLSSTASSVLSSSSSSSSSAADGSTTPDAIQQGELNQAVAERRLGLAVVIVVSCASLFSFLA